LHSKDNEAARRRLHRCILEYVEEADNAANNVSQRRQNWHEELENDPASKEPINVLNKEMGSAERTCS
jgi:hypothetical protein